MPYIFDATHSIYYLYLYAKNDRFILNSKTKHENRSMCDQFTFSINIILSSFNCNDVKLYFISEFPWVQTYLFWNWKKRLSIVWKILGALKINHYATCYLENCVENWGHRRSFFFIDLKYGWDISNTYYQIGFFFCNQKYLFYKI